MFPVLDAECLRAEYEQHWIKTLFWTEDFWHSHRMERSRVFCGISPVAFTRVPSSWLKHLLKATSSNTIRLYIMTPTYEFFKDSYSGHNTKHGAFQSRWWNTQMWNQYPPFINRSKRPSTCGKILTEYLLNAGRSQTAKTARKVSM